MQETPAADELARDLAEAIFTAFETQASSRLHPNNVQILLTRLAEAIGPEVAASPGAVVVAANAVLDAWEQTNDDVRGPRVASLSLPGRSVTMTLHG